MSLATAASRIHPWGMSRHSELIQRFCKNLGTDHIFVDGPAFRDIMLSQEDDKSIDPGVIERFVLCIQCSNHIVTAHPHKLSMVGQAFTGYTSSRNGLSCQAACMYCICSILYVLLELGHIGTLRKGSVSTIILSAKVWGTH